MIKQEDKPVRHLLGLSGGKDSSALAIYMRDRVPEMEYFFSDTGAELPETLAYIDLLEDYLGKSIIRLSPLPNESKNKENAFDYYLKLHNNFLPSPQQRWCTTNLKLFPFEKFVGNDDVINYVAIRADEPKRTGYYSKRGNIKTIMPFKDDNLVKEDVYRILESSGLGIPEYYKWRSRSGCYFCFFQRKNEWAGLKEKYPDLFEAAKEYENEDPTTGKKYTWNQLGGLDVVVANAETEDMLTTERKKSKNLMENIDSDDDGCLICML